MCFLLGLATVSPRLAARASGNPHNALDNDQLVLRIPWKKTPMKRRREIIVPASVSPYDLRPIRAETRAPLIAAIARGRRWVDEIVAGTVTGVDCCTGKMQHSTSQYDDLVRVPRT